MVIGIIGAGISGLTAGRLLAKAGHEVTVFEKSRGYGGRLATRYTGEKLEQRIDHGTPYFEVATPEFKEFITELTENNLVKPWGNKFKFYDGEKLLNENPNNDDYPVFTSVYGMNTIGKHLARWVDVKENTKVGGLTYFGDNRSRKRPWIINLTSSETFGADAVILALPAPQAYGILSTTVDETNTLKIIRQIDDVHYRPSYSLIVGYNGIDIPDWEAITCKSDVLDTISNEGLKRNGEQGTAFVLKANEQFTRTHSNRNSDNAVIIKSMISEFANIVGGWASSPQSHQLHLWKFSQAKSSLDLPYFELEDEKSPLALVGDYYEGRTVGHAYSSGVKLANHWIEKFHN